MRKKILVVDDNRLMREFMTNFLQGKGMQVYLAENGFDALNLLTSIRPEIIFIDLVMPKIDGSKLCRIIRNMAHLEDCFLVVLSAAAAEIGDDYKEFGADACIAKGAFDQMARHVMAVVEMAEKKDRTSQPILGAEQIQPRQMTRELLRRNRHLESIIDSISDGIIEIYSDRVVYANPAAGFLFGRPPDTLIGSVFPQLFSAAVQPQIINLMVEDHIPPPGTVDAVVSKGHQERQVVVKRLIHATEVDTHLFLLTDVTDLKRADEKIQRTRQKLQEEVARRTADLTRTNQQLKQEINERRKADAALLESQKLFNQFMQHMPALAFIKDLEGRYIYVNEGYRKYFGLDLQDRIGKTDDELWPPEIAQQLRKNDSQVVARNESIVKVEIIKIDKQNRHQLVSKFPILKEGRLYAVGGLAVDITHRVQAEEERFKLAEKLQDGSKMEAIGNLAGGVAHDLNNILSVIVGYPELMLMDLDEKSPLRQQLLTIKKAGEKAAATVQDLLVLARRDIATSKVVNFNDIVNQYRQGRHHARLLNDRPDLEFTIQLDPHLLNIIGSPTHLEKTISHLVANAACAVLNGGLIRISTANIHLETPLPEAAEMVPGDYITLTVADSGRPLEPEQRERIFEPFYTSKVLGRNDTGLGMAVVWGTVNDHKGYIDLHTTDEGNTFTLYFPATLQTTVDAAGNVAPAETIAGNGESILVVDDVEDQRNIARDMLEKLGYRVEAVTSGEEAVAWLKAHKADLVILDMIMDPGIDGLETYKQILEIQPGQKAIIASGYSESDRVREARRLGTGAYIKKPYLIEEIGRAIRSELDR
jgi:two-component system, cell cycle sensor histidine kinase and response regulator CckA